MIKKVVEQFSKKLNSFGTITLAFSILSTIAKLKSWQEFIDFISGISEEFFLILEFFGRIINLILIPYRWFANFIFQFVPISIPYEWQDPIIIGFMVLLIPVYEIYYYSQFSKPLIAIRQIRKLSETISNKKLFNNSKIVLKVKKLIGKFPYLVQKPINDITENFLESLKTNQNKKKIEIERQVLKKNITNQLLPCIPELQDVLIEYYKKIKYNRIRSGCAVLVLIFLSIDSFYSNSNIEFTAILGKSLISMIIFSLIPFLLSFLIGLILLLIYYSLGFLTRNKLINKNSELPDKIRDLMSIISLFPFGILHTKKSKKIEGEVLQIINKHLI